MAGPARADLLVGRIGGRAPHVAGFDRHDAFRLVIHRFETPEAATG